MNTSTAFAPFSARWFRAACLLSALAGLTAVTVGCGCGAAAVPTDGDGGAARVNQQGVVIFEPTAVGDTVSFEIPIKDTADVQETLISASISGPDAADFDVVAKFPIDMPAGDEVHVELRFHPAKVGNVSAELMLQTEDMGISPIPLKGVGAAPETD